MRIRTVCVFIISIVTALFTVQAFYSNEASAQTALNYLDRTAEHAEQLKESPHNKVWRIPPLW